MGIRFDMLGFEEGFTFYEIERLGRFLDLVEPHIDDARKAWERKIRDQASQISDSEARDEFLDFSSDEYWEFEEYERILRNSFLVTCFSFLEARLNWFCKTLQNRADLTISLHKIAGNDVLDRARIYLADVGKISFPSDGIDWQTIRRYEGLRHYAVHRGGRIPKDDKPVWDFALARRLIRGDGSVDEDVMLLHSGDCRDLLKNVGDFFKTLHAELRRVTEGQKENS